MAQILAKETILHCSLQINKHLIYELQIYYFCFFPQLISNKRYTLHEIIN